MSSEKTAQIDNSKCVMCGACVVNCPFGAIVDKSYVLDCIKILEDAKKEGTKVYAVIAPAIVSQFKYAKIEQIVTGIKNLGFHEVVEAALGADITLGDEIEEFKEKDVMTTSCCPSFVMYIEKSFPKLVPLLSHSVSPMITAARLIKNTVEGAKCIFIGPCSSKKHEFKLEKTGGAIECVMSFEELQSFLDARGIDVSTLEEKPLDNASFYGRIFARSGGITTGVQELARERGVTKELCPLAVSGLDMLKTTLLKLNVGKLDANFIEGMACEGGCLNGALCLTHGDKNVKDVDKYGQMAKEQNISSSMKLFELSQINN